MMIETAAKEVALQEREVDLRGFVDILRRRFFIVAGVFVASIVLALVASLLARPVYRASTTMIADRATPTGLLPLGGASLLADQAGLQAPDVFTLSELIKSRSVRQEARRRLKTTETERDADQALRTLTVGSIKNTPLVWLYIEHTNPKVAKAGADAVATAVIDLNLDRMRAGITQTRVFIGRELDRARDKMRAAERAIVAFKARTGVLSLDTQVLQSLQQISNLQAQLVVTELERKQAQASVATIRQRLTGQSRIAINAWTPSPVVTGLQNQLAQLEIELVGLQREFTPRHPAVIQAQAKIQETRRRLQEAASSRLQPSQYSVDPIYQMMTQELAEAQLQLGTVQARERVLRNAIAEINLEARGMPPREAELLNLTRDLTEAEGVFTLLSQKFLETKIAETSVGSTLRVVDPATIPGSPVRPRRLLNLLLGGVIGLLLGAASAFAAEQLDDTVKSSEDVERILGVPVLGTIPILNGTRPRRGGVELSASSLVTNTDRRSPAAEAFRGLRTHVLFSMPDIEHKRFLITSALPTEGKSTVAANLALVLARTDRKVWLVDADLRRPAVGRFFPEATSKGLATFLVGDATVEDVLRPAKETNLWCVTSGPTVPNPSELLGAQRLAQFMREARAQADVVLIDAPPVLPVTDAEVVAPHADGVLLVVRVGFSDRRALMHARQRLARVGIRLLGVVLNFVPTDRRGGHYYQSYYNGKYYGDTVKTGDGDRRTPSARRTEVRQTQGRKRRAKKT